MGGRPAWWALGVAIHLCCRYSYTQTKQLEVSLLGLGLGVTIQHMPVYIYAYKRQSRMSQPRPTNQIMPQIWGENSPGPNYHFQMILRVCGVSFQYNYKYNYVDSTSYKHFSIVNKNNISCHIVAVKMSFS